MKLWSNSIHSAHSLCECWLWDITHMIISESIHNRASSFECLEGWDLFHKKGSFQWNAKCLKLTHLKYQFVSVFIHGHLYAKVCWLGEKLSFSGANFAVLWEHTGENLMWTPRIDSCLLHDAVPWGFVAHYPAFFRYCMTLGSNLITNMERYVKWDDLLLRTINNSYYPGQRSLQEVWRFHRHSNAEPIPSQIDIWNQLPKIH